ncbi:MAG: peptidoglycan-associated lipoprotein Pal [Burkholderiaceae bacterium]|nr:peptidoglycan-associated lipoprotein Pal [Burkholderiaceae bacterium]
MNGLRVLLIASLAVTLAACGSSVKLDDENAAKVVDRSGAAGAGGAGAGGTTGGVGAGSRTVTPVVADQKDPLEDPKGVLAKRSVYFDFDSFVIRDEFRPVLEAHSRYLSGNRGKRIVIQGNTDERGSREYNLALGQKRAEAVRRSMLVLGVGETQMEAVSFGEERPKATGSNETAWAENRRADIVYK